MKIKPSEFVLNGLKEVDQHYEECLNAGASWKDDLWFKWARPFNVMLRDKIYNEKPADLMLVQYLYMYCLNRARILDIHKVKPFFYKKTLVKMDKEASILRQSIMTGNIDHDYRFKGNAGISFRSK